MTIIRELFSEQRPIDRPIEKVIDYTADSPGRLSREIDEYIVTDRIEESFRRFIEVYEAGVRRGDVTEVGIWVSGFYGSSSIIFATTSSGNCFVLRQRVSLQPLCFWT
jgi:hypothetical protein